MKPLWFTILCGLLMSIAAAGSVRKNNNATDLLMEVNEDTKNRTDNDGKNREGTHGSVEDLRDSRHGKMEELIRIFEERERFLKEMKSRNGGKDVDVDPNDELQKKYEQLKKEIMEEYDGIFFDPQKEAEENETMDNSTNGELKRGKRWNWGGYWAEWPKAIIPYEFHGGDVVGANNAMDRYEELTCMRFVPHVDASTNDNLDLGHPGYLKFIKKDGCWSYIGNHRWADGQSISCCEDTKCVHELGHAFGMLHEQNNYLRDGWIRINPQNVIEGDEDIYQRGAEGTHFSLGYDLSTLMHYKPKDFSRGSGRPTMTVLFPELSFANEDFYMFREVNYVQGCKNVELCADFTTECENDGYVSVINGICTCRCPLGLDPTTGCTTTLKTSSIHADIPRGQYALLKPKTGCPESKYSYKEGKVIHYGDGTNYDTGNVLEGELSQAKAEHHFCVHDDETFDGNVEGFFRPKSTWPVGKYCILRKGGKCPHGLLPGHVKYGDMPETDANKNSQEGELPDGSYGNDTRLEFCCQYNGISKNPAVFPVSKPFVLFPTDYNVCQHVLGMHYKTHKLGFNNDDDKGYEIEGLMSRFEMEFNQYLALDYCYYTKADMDCGDVITLTSENPETVIEMDSTGRSDLECTWLVKGENEEGNVMLDFEEFEVGIDNSVEVRYARIGQIGVRYGRGDTPRTIKSIYDKMMIKLSTQGETISKIKGIARWVPNGEMCYDVSNKGVTYSGDVNYTKDLEPCLPWSEVTICPHHPWALGDELANLEGNSCRNPDNSFGPWCYTEKDVNGCKRNYCDVCHKETLFDRSTECEKQKSEGFCSSDPISALNNCALTCREELPNMGPEKKYTEIQCDPPTSPVDGEIVGEGKLKYDFGEEVKFKCKHGGRSMSKTCLTSGDWTPLGFVCIECPIGSVIENNTCYYFIDRQMNYVEAKKECNEIGGQAAMPKTFEQNVFISEVGQGKSLWLGISDRETEGTWIFEDGTSAEWVNWGGSEPNNWNNEEHCASLEADTKEWADRVCDYTATWAKMAVVCEVPRVTTLECADFLEKKRCVELLTEKPSMCHEYPSFAEEYCAKTCGVCGAEDISCSINIEDPNTIVSTDNESISVGDKVTFSCKPDTVVVNGNEQRACLPSGELTGVPLSCKDPNENMVTVDVGAEEIAKSAYNLPYHTIYTGENDQWTIKDTGEIIGWEFYSNSPSENAFQVWRVIEPKSVYQFVGQTIIKTGNDMEECYELSEEERIPVQPGDLIAIWKADSGGVNFNRCNNILHPTWAGTSWSDSMVASASDLTAGDQMNFRSALGCATYAFRAVVAVKN